MPVPCFLLFLVSEKVLKEISAVLEINQPGIIYGIFAFQEAEEETKTMPEGPTSCPGAAPFLAALGGGVGPTEVHRLRPFAYIYPPD